MAAMKKRSPARVKRLQQISRAHDTWVKQNLHLVSMDPKKSRKGSDYNLHYLDVDAPPKIEEKFQQMLRRGKK